MQADGKVGLQAGSDGTFLTLRLDKSGALIVSSGHGYYAEPALRGAIMEGANAIAGIAPGTTFTTTPPLALWNPPASGKNLILLKAAMGYISGTLGAGSIMLGHIQAQTTVPTTGTELTPICSAIGLPRGVGRLFAGSTFASAAAIIRPLFTVGAFLATTPQVPVDTVDVIDGSIIITPGSAVALQEVGAAGTSPLVCFAFTWEEVPI